MKKNSHAIRFIKKLIRTAAVFLFAFISFKVSAQNFWSTHAVNDIQLKDKSVARLSFPKTFQLFNVNIEPLRRELFTVVDNSAKQSTVIILPNADGGTEQFQVVEASNFHPALQAKFPEIRAYSGKGITDKAATLKLSISPQGIQAMIFRTDKENEFIEPYSKDHLVYAVFKSQREKGKLPWTCTTDDKQMAVDIHAQVSKNNLPASSAGQLKTMRLAQSVTAEYSNYFGATSSSQVGLVLAAINATLTRCNGCYEKDLGVHLNLVPNEGDIIFYDPSTDPYDDPSTGASGAETWHGQLQATLTANIGEANYDIGHLFGQSGGGGNAGCIGCVCVDGSKGKGFTSPADGIPEGDNFDIDYVVHEVGHQMGGNHTFSYKDEGGGVGMEVASGITIMAYAGVTSYNVAPHSIDIYHAISIQQIQSNLAGKSCPVSTSISGNNATPSVNPVSNRTIPKSTPFALSGSASDADGDPLTYCWEQMDDGAGQIAGNSKAYQSKPSGPNWLSFSPTSGGTRLFPKLATILAGNLTTGPLPGGTGGIDIEALSSVGRDLHFRLTVRDNHPFSSSAPVAVGQTNYTDMTVTVDGSKGPFEVTAPNTNVTWCPGSHTVTWSVNGSDALAANVNILLSTGGGNTFPITLASNTPNDGSESVTIGCTHSSAARIKIEAVGNIFFDISNANFTVGDNTPPTFTRPPNITIYTDASCNYDASTGVTGDVTNEADNCSTGLNATYTDIVANGPCEGSHVITRTWHLEDGCGNAAADQVQVITVSDNIKPTFTRPANTTIYTDASCGYNASPAITGDVTDEADNCSTGINAVYSDNVANGPCEGSKVITRTWMLTDKCGNAAPNQVQIITVSDTTRPTFTRPPDTVIPFTTTCGYDPSVSNTGDVTDEHDNCSTGLQATYSDVIVPCGNDLIITRTWSLVDHCGNAAADQVQKIRVTDNNTAYIIYASKEAKFGESNTIGGDVGVTDIIGKAEFKKNDQLDPYHVYATNITTQLPSAVNNKHFVPAVGGPNPPFYAYTGTGGVGNFTASVNGVVNGNYKDLTIKKNVVATVTGNDFGKITIEEGADVTFTSSAINTQELNVKKGKKNVSTTKVHFAGCTGVMARDKVSIEEDCQINVAGPKVIFYMGDASKDEEKFVVNGNNSIVTANVMIPHGKMQIHGGDQNNCSMMGWYIVEKLDGDGKYVTWSKYDCAPLLKQVYTQPATIPQLFSLARLFDVKVSPNPFNNEFRIQLINSGNEPVTVRVMNVSGNVLKVNTSIVKGSITINGSDLKGGTYFADVIQGGNHKIVKLVKLN